MMGITALVLYLLLTPSLAAHGQNDPGLSLARLEGGDQAIQNNIMQLLGRLETVPDIIRIGIYKLGLSWAWAKLNLI